MGATPPTTRAAARGPRQPAGNEAAAGGTIAPGAPGTGPGRGGTAGGDRMTFAKVFLPWVLTRFAHLSKLAQLIHISKTFT